MRPDATRGKPPEGRGLVLTASATAATTAVTTAAIAATTITATTAAAAIAAAAIAAAVVFTARCTLLFAPSAQNVTTPHSPYW